MKNIERVEELLLTTEEPVSADYLVEQTGFARASVFIHISMLRKKYGERLAKWTRRRQVAYRILPLPGKKVPKVRVDDLWRGWRNPITGYQPERLGL